MANLGEIFCKSSVHVLLVHLSSYCTQPRPQTCLIHTPPGLTRTSCASCAACRARAPCLALHGDCGTWCHRRGSGCPPGQICLITGACVLIGEQDNRLVNHCLNVNYFIILSSDALLLCLWMHSWRNRGFQPGGSLNTIV